MIAGMQLHHRPGHESPNVPAAATQYARANQLVLWAASRRATNGTHCSSAVSIAKLW